MSKQNNLTNKYGLKIICVEVDGVTKSVIINNEGKQIVEPKYDYISEYDNNGFIRVLINNEDVRKLKFGCIDISGNEIISPKYNALSEFNEYGLARFTMVFNDFGLCGLVNTKGEEILQPKYNNIYTHYHDYNNKLKTRLDVDDISYYGFIDINGEEIVEPKYTEIHSQLCGFIIVELENNGIIKKGLLNRHYKEILKPIYSEIVILSTYSVKADDEYVEFNMNIIN